MTRNWLWFVTLTVAASAGAAPANLQSTSDDITIDGVMDEAAWQHATQINLDIETRPGENTAAKVATVVYLLEDGRNLYVAFDARDPDPSEIRAYLRDRDTAWNDDIVGIVLDTFNDDRRAFEFFANPLGVQMDATNDDVNQRYDSSWDAIWDSAGKIGESGYVVEMEIPLSQLRFPGSSEMQTWGFDLIRFYPRDNRYRLSNNSTDRAINCYLCQLGEFEGLEDVQPGRNLEVVPTVTAIKTDFTDDPGNVPLESGDTDVEAGLSVRWGITPDMTANLAINPDFSQVEADIAQLQVNNQFALFFPERRPFFLEGADYFTTPLEAVFTRTVADPDFGAKITGKRGNNTLGAYVAEDAITNLLFPGAFYSDSTSLEQNNTTFVGRYSRGFGGASNFGAVITTRDGDEYHNHVGGLDLHWRINDQHSIDMQYLRSDTEYPVEVAVDFDQPLSSFSGEALYASYDYDSRNWFAHLEHQDLDDGFRADSGFVPQVGVSWQLFRGGRIWHGTEDNWWTRMNLVGAAYITHDSEGRMIDRANDISYGVSGPMQSWTEIGYQRGDFLWDDILFERDETYFFTQVRPKGGLRLSLFAAIGSQIDFANSRLGDQLLLEPAVEWNINRHLMLNMEGSLVDFDSKEGAQIFDASVFNLRLTWQFNRRAFLRLTTQHQDIERNVDEYIEAVDAKTRNMGRQLLFSYKVNPQTVFFLGYSDNLYEGDQLDRLEETDRTWFMKIGYAFTP